jgi:hypothetical protein
MRIDRLADFLDLKYRLISVAAEPMPVSPAIMAEVRKRLKVLREMWLDGPRVKDQSILAWADDDNKGPQFDLIRELVAIVKTLAVNPSLGPTDTYRAVQRGLTISKILKDFSLTEIKDAMKLSLKGNMRHPDLNRFEHQESKIRTFLRRLDGGFDEVRSTLSKFVPSAEKSAIDKESIGGYELQKAKGLSKDNLLSFTTHPEAHRYGLDNTEFLSKLLNETKLRPLVENLIRSVRRGHSPKAAPVILTAHDSFQDLIKKLQTNNALFDDTEEGAREQMDFGRRQEELEDKQKELDALNPNQRWSRQMQEAKQQKLLEQEQNPSVLTPDQLQERIEQRDLEHEQRVEQKRQQEEALISKYNGLTFDRWMRIK